MARSYKELERMFGGASALPQPSKSPLRLAAMLEAGEPKQSEIEQVVLSDPALTAGLLRSASSAAFGRQRQVTTVREAVMVLGFRSVRSLAVALWTQALVSEGKHSSRLDLDRFSRGSFVTGCLASDLFAGSKPTDEGRWTAEEVFSLGVLARLGLGLLSLLAPDEFDDVYGLAKEAAVSLEQAFTDRHGQSVATLAALASEAMGLPDGLVQAMQTYAGAPGEPAAEDACRFVHAARRLVDGQGLGVVPWTVTADTDGSPVPDCGTIDMEPSLSRAVAAATTVFKAA
ncbi:MAG: HDOD domain-containing protein [Fimbriimonadaceae bacterium]|nr:HDOD domain-containing protein [Fimbriimonadaceae bacterium]